MKRMLVVGLCACGWACGSQSPMAPSAADQRPSADAPPPADGVHTVNGQLVASNGGQPLGGVNVGTLGVVSTITDGDGEFALSVSDLQSLAALEFTGPSIVPRQVLLTVGAQAVGLDAISLSGGFSLDYYRQLARNGWEQRGWLQPIRRWTQAPRVYLRTVFGNRPVDDSTLAMVADTIQQAVNDWSGGTLGVAQLERGTGTREGQAGWITVLWTEELGNAFCGDALVAADPGLIRLHPRLAGCRCAGEPGQVSRWVVFHEVGHAMGFWHTSHTDDVMYNTFNACNGGLSERERQHAAIVYKRPNGNTDPDVDPLSIAALGASAQRVP